MRAHGVHTCAGSGTFSTRAVVGYRDAHVFFLSVCVSVIKRKLLISKGSRATEVLVLHDPKSVWLFAVQVLVYSGQKDLRTPFSSLERFMRSLRWKGQLEYNATNRASWCLANARVAGYYKVVRNYAEVLVRGAGHVVPFDKPREMFTLITRFVYGLPIADAQVDK